VADQAASLTLSHGFYDEGELAMISAETLSFDGKSADLLEKSLTGVTNESR
jgi:hypothetical protein